jgi:hypothetical protein
MTGCIFSLVQDTIYNNLDFHSICIFQGKSPSVLQFFGMASPPQPWAGQAETVVWQRQVSYRRQACNFHKDRASVYNKSRQKWAHGDVGAVRFFPTWLKNLLILFGTLIVIMILFLTGDYF